MERCGLSLRVPVLIDFFDRAIWPGCVGDAKTEGATLSMGYAFYPDDPAWASKYISMEIQPIGIDEWVTPDHGHHTTFAKSGDSVELLPRYSFGNECQNLRKTEITPIYGINWHGWVAEEIYGKSKMQAKEKKRCANYTVKNRCVHLVLGNDKMSAEMPWACLLRKKTTNLKEGLSYDLFMEMIRSIQFSEQ